MNNLTKDILVSVGAIITCHTTLYFIGVSPIVTLAMVLPVAGYLGKQLACATITDPATGIEE